MRHGVLAASLAICLANGCVPKAQYDDMMADQGRLYDRIDGMKNAMEQMSVELKRLKKQVVETQNELDENKRKLAIKIIETGELEEDIDTLQAAIAGPKSAEVRQKPACPPTRTYLHAFKP